MIHARFHLAAVQEIESEHERYAEVSLMLGEAFVSSIEAELRLARQFPEMDAPYKDGTRRVFPKRFPYSLVYLHRGGEIYVLTLAPFRRKPGYWKSRQGKK